MFPVDAEKMLNRIHMQRFSGMVLFKTHDVQAELGFQSSVSGMPCHMEAIKIGWTYLRVPIFQSIRLHDIPRAFFVQICQKRANDGRVGTAEVEALRDASTTRGSRSTQSQLSSFCPRRTRCCQTACRVTRVSSCICVSMARTRAS